MLIFLEWLASFGMAGLDATRLSMIGPDQSLVLILFTPISSHSIVCWQVLGSVIFNFAFVVTVPSWVNEKANISFVSFHPLDAVVLYLELCAGKERGSQSIYMAFYNWMHCILYLIGRIGFVPTFLDLLLISN